MTTETRHRANNTGISPPAGGEGIDGMTQDKRIEEPTPLPWQADDSFPNRRQLYGLGWSRLVATVPIRQTHAAEDEANAQLIVRAVNNHDRLLAALEMIAAGHHYRHLDENDERSDLGCAPCLARAAIAAAKGETE